MAMRVTIMLKTDNQQKERDERSCICNNDNRESSLSDLPTVDCAHLEKACGSEAKGRSPFSIVRCWQ